jgi:hypothetical protein
MKYYWYKSFHHNMVLMILQPIEFTDADINYLFYVSHIGV